VSRARGDYGEAGSNIPGESTKGSARRSAGRCRHARRESPGCCRRCPERSARCKRETRTCPLARCPRSAQGCPRHWPFGFADHLVAWQVGGNEQRARRNAPLRVRRYLRIGTRRSNAGQRSGHRAGHCRNVAGERWHARGPRSSGDFGAREIDGRRGDDLGAVELQPMADNSLNRIAFVARLRSQLKSAGTPVQVTTATSIRRKRGCHCVSQRL
jgi:hypothetical protein